MTRSVILGLAVGVLVWRAGMPLARAHGDLHERIVAQTAALAAAPDEAALLLARGLLYLQRGDVGAARADFREAERLDSALPGLDQAMGAACLRAGAYAEAITRFDAHLRGAPDDAAVLTLRARARSGAEDFAGAVVDFTRALAAAAAPTPELYIERAEALVRDGRADEAVRSLDEGLVRLGPVVTLQERALALELARGRTDAALVRLDALAAATPRPESLLARKGEVLAAAGRRAEAAQAYRAALAATERLPPRARAAEWVQSLEQRIAAALVAEGVP